MDRSQGGTVGEIIFLIVGEERRGNGRGIDKMYFCLTTLRYPSARNRLGRDKKVSLKLWQTHDGGIVVGLSFRAESKESGKARSLCANWRNKRPVDRVG